MDSLTTNSKFSPLGQLRRQWAALALVAAVLLAAGYWLLSAHWHPGTALLWASLAAGALTYQLVLHYSDLQLNHRQGEGLLLPSFGPGTRLSLLRILCFGLMAGFLALPSPIGWLAWIPFFLNLLANATDFFDGYLARLSNHVTELGAKLDQDLDGRGLLLVSLLAYQYGAVPAWFLLVGAARYLYLFGLWLHQRRGGNIEDLAPNPVRRALAGAQMGLSTAMLAPILAPPETVIAAALFTIPFLANFLYDYLQVTRQLPQALLAWAAWPHLRNWSRNWLPLALRVGAFGLLGLRFMQSSAGTIFAPADILLAASLALGAAGRLFAALAMIVTGFHIHFFPGYVADLWLIPLLALLFYLGSGRFSLWTPEDAWIRQRAGERRTQ